MSTENGRFLGKKSVCVSFLGEQLRQCGEVMVFLTECVNLVLGEVGGFGNL
jgi:hypothetical protein